MEEGASRILPVAMIVTGLFYLITHARQFFDGIAFIYLQPAKQ